MDRRKELPSKLIPTKRQMDQAYWSNLMHGKKYPCKAPIKGKRTNSRYYLKGMYLSPHIPSVLPPIPSDPWRHDDIFLIFNRSLKLIKIMSYHGSSSVFKIVLGCLHLVLELCGPYNLNSQYICCLKKSPLCVIDVGHWFPNPCHTYVVGNV